MMDTALINNKLAGIDQLVSEIRGLVNEVPVPPDPPPDPPSDGDKEIIRMVGQSLVTIRAATKYAGAIDSLMWNGKEFISRTCTGDLLQTALCCNDLAERYNPTEAGNRSGDPSRLISMTASGNVLNTKCQMAFYLSPGEVSNPNGEGPQTLPAVNTTELSDYILTKKVTIGHPSSDHVIEFLLNIKIPESCDAIIEALTGYMPAEFNQFYTYDNATHDLSPIDAGPGEQPLPLVFACGDTHAMGIYCPDLPIQNQYKYLGYGRSAPPWVAPGMVKWNMVFRMNGLTPGDYAFRCYVIVGTLENVRVSMIQLHNYFAGVTPTPQPDPTPGTEIKVFNAIPALDDPDNCYFTACRVNEKMNFATYKDGSYKSYIRDITGKDLGSFNCESCFMIIPFKGGFNMSQEHGKAGTVDRGMIYRLINGIWQEVYRHPRWTIITEMHEHDGYLYATGCKVGDPSDPAGWVRSADGISWSVWGENAYEYRPWGMASKDGNLWSAATSSGTDWGSNNCNPAVFKNRDMVWRDYDHVNSGFWGIESWHNDLWLGRCGDAAVVRFSDKKEVLLMPGYGAIHDFVVDKKADTLIALVNKDGNDGAIVKATKNGTDWYTMDSGFSVPLIFDGHYDDLEGEIYLCSGVFGGRGKMYKSVR